jgi:hypothetical protein
MKKPYLFGWCCGLVLIAALVLGTSILVHAQSPQSLLRYQIATTPDFLSRIQFLSTKVALAVSEESLTTCCYPAGVTHGAATWTQQNTARDLHNRRLMFAQQVLSSPAGVAPRLALAVTTNMALTSVNATDTEIEATLVAQWNAFAGPAPVAPLPQPAPPE